MMILDVAFEECSIRKSYGTSLGIHRRYPFDKKESLAGFVYHVSGICVEVQLTANRGAKIFILLKSFDSCIINHNGWWVRMVTLMALTCVDISLSVECLQRVGVLLPARLSCMLVVC